MKQVLKLLFEVGPLVIFFVSYNKFDIFVATQAFMVATAVSLTGSWLIFKKIAAMPLVSGVIVFVFGGLTVFLHDDTFIKMKPTIVNSLFASILFIGLYFDKLFLKIVFEDAFQLTDEGWVKLTYRWAFFFLFLAFLNEFVWRGSLAYYEDSKQATDLWVNFKFFCLAPMTMVFAMTQIGLIQKYAIEPETANPETKI